MWIWTLDAKLVNLALVESIELLEVFPEGSELPDADDDEAEPDFLELVAVMPSGQEALLFQSDDAELAQQAYEAVASFVAGGGLIDGVQPHQPISVALLLERTRTTKN